MVWDGEGVGVVGSMGWRGVGVCDWGVEQKEARGMTRSRCDVMCGTVCVCMCMGEGGRAFICVWRCVTVSVDTCVDGGGRADDGVIG